MLYVYVGKNAGESEELKWESMATEQIATLASTGGLFGGSQVFSMRGALNGERAEEFLEIAEGLVASPHTFIFEEEKLLKAETEKIKKAGGTIEIVKAEKKEYRFDNFGVASALGAKDKKALWLGLMASWSAGEKPEAVAGLMCWKARQMRNVPLSRALVKLYHDSHRGAGELDLLLERFALKL